MTLTFKEVSEVLKIIDASECEEVVLELEGMKLVVRRSASGSASTASPVASPVITASEISISSTPTGEIGAAARTSQFPPSAPSESIESGIQVRAPMVGSFYRRPAPDQPPFVEVGSKVKTGDPLCLIEVMKLYTTIEASADGTIKQIAAEDAGLVEFDQLLFVIAPD
ncbi:MAG: acetyl-CoA carboxylase biotin carboxyl carrier protein [Hyphomicrobiaceae bacterium]